MDARDNTEVVTVFIRHRGEVLLKRSDTVESYRGVWGAVSGVVDGDLDATARLEIAKETAPGDAVTRVAAGKPFTVEDRENGRTWTVHPFLFEAASRDVALDKERAAVEWLPPTAILRRDTVPGLWTAYDRVRPSPESIAADRTHGSAWLSIRALEVLRDEAAVLGATVDDPAAVWTELEAVAGALLEARPSMTALGNRVRRVMAERQADATADRVEAVAIEEIESALAADRRAAEAILPRIADRTVLTISRSGTVLEALQSAPAHVFVAESRPGCEGVGVAEALADAGVPTTLCIDAAVASVLLRYDIDAVVVGADTILADGSVVNKVGTCGTAIVARDHDVPVYVVAAADKVAPRTDPVLEFGPPSAVYDGDCDLTVDTPIFDVTPARCIAAYGTDRGVIDEEAVTDIAREHRDGMSSG